MFIDNCKITEDRLEDAPQLNEDYKNLLANNCLFYLNHCLLWNEEVCDKD